MEEISVEEHSNELNSNNSTDETIKTENSDVPESVSIDHSEQIEINRLSAIIKNQTNEISELNTRLTVCQQHYETLLNRQKDEYLREKQSAVMRYAQAEKAKLDSDKKCDLATAKTNDLLKEKDNLQQKLSEFKLMNTKLQQAFENKLAELTTTKKDFDKLKELNLSLDASLKSTLNHLKGETIQLKEQREMNERLKKDLNEQHETIEKLNLQCKQLNETIQAIPTDDERTQAYEKLLNEHNSLKIKLTNIQEENNIFRDKLKSADEDRLALENVIENFRHNSLKEKEATKKLYDDLLAAREQDSVEISRLKQLELNYNQTLNDNADLRQLLENEHQILELTQKLTEKNSILQSDYEQLQISYRKISDDYEHTKKLYDEQINEISKLKTIEKCLNQQIEQLNEKYQIASKSYEQVQKQYDDSLVEIQTLKKKHQANTKDLIKQLQQLQKAKPSTNGDGQTPVSLAVQTKTLPNKDNNPSENTSNRGSPTGSSCSLNDISPAISITSSEQCSTQLQTPQQPIVLPEEEPEIIVNIVDVDRQKLIDKLIKQQKLLVKRNEKIEFLNDHIQILTQDLQNKRKIIQSYAMSEDGFMYTSNQSDSMRQQLGNKTRANSSSLMGTLYNRATTNASYPLTSKMFEQSSPMTLETSLDIMGKLQSVLEDTLLKNLTLKENVDTLSKEIERLSRRTIN